MKVSFGVVMGLNSACYCLRYPLCVRTAQRKDSLLQGDWMWFLSKLCLIVLSEKWTHVYLPSHLRETANGTYSLSV